MGDFNSSQHSQSFFVVFDCRIQKATDSLRTFHPAADTCFDEFVLDTSREETLLKEMCFGGGTEMHREFEFLLG